MSSHGPGSFTGWNKETYRTMQDDKSIVDAEKQRQKFHDHRAEMAKEADPLTAEELDKAKNVAVRRLARKVQAEGVSGMSPKDLISAIEVLDKARMDIRAAGDTESAAKSATTREEALAALQGKVAGP
jgi:hypothetical protein